MSDDKKYTAEEVAKMIADKAAEVMKKHEISSEYMEQVLEKSKNKAHEIDAGEEPNNDDAECPASLCEGGSEKSESSESASMEDQPLQGDEDSDTEEEETEEDEEDEDEYEFKKSEACGHIIEYKMLKSNGNIKFKHSNEAGQQTNQSDAQQAVSGVTRKAKLEDQDEGKKQKRHRMNVDRTQDGKTYGKKDRRKKEGTIEDREEGHRSANTPKYTGPERREKTRGRGQGHIYQEGEMKESEGMDKCGEMTYKSESGMHTVEYKRLAKGSKIDNYYREKNPKGKGYFVDADSETHMANRRAENKKTKEKGVNQAYDNPEWSQDKKKQSAEEHGVSEGGARSRAAVRSKKAGDSQAADIHNKKAKEAHAKTLAEMKATKKPNLPKSEMTYKSESGMHTVEYKRLAKGRMATPEELATLKQKKPKSDHMRPRGVEDLVNKPKATTEEEKKPKTSSNHMRPKGVEDLVASEDAKVKETKGIDFDKENVSDKGQEEKEGKKRPLEKDEMEKCGEMTSGKKLKKFMSKKAQG